MKSTRVIVARRGKNNLFLRLKHILCRPGFSIDQDALAGFLHEDELDAKEHIGNGLIDKEEVTFFYPGCGMDLVQPLLYVSRIADSSRKMTIVMADRDISADNIVSLMIQLTGNHNYRIRRGKGSEQVTFRFKDKTIRIICKEGDILRNLPSELKDGYDIYFERAFEICREDSPSFIRRSISLLNKGGIFITDAGLDEDSREGMAALKISPKVRALGFYKSLSIYRK